MFNELRKGGFYLGGKYYPPIMGGAGPGVPLASEPTIWSSRILEYLDKSFMYVQALTNNNYEGEAKKGGTVKAFYVSDVVVTDYTGAWLDADWGTLGDNAVTIQIDKQKKVLIKVPKVREHFSELQLIDQGSQRAAVAIGDVIDQAIAANYSSIAVANAYGDDVTPITVGLGAGQVAPSVALAILREKLVAAKAPHTNPRVVLPEWFGTMLYIELSGRNTSLGDAATRGQFAVDAGKMDPVSGLIPYVSPNVPNTTATKYKVMAGDPMITFASAIDEMDTVQLINDFATGVRGLWVWGSMLPRAEYMALGTFNKGAYGA
ncbi:MAG: hypothetical protein M1455_06400 [Actinobacteria bacterium]|nr:hypothetical protein [Actinomycetota bacterium]